MLISAKKPNDLILIAYTEKDLINEFCISSLNKIAF